VITKARIDDAVEKLLTHIDKYDNGIITRDALATMVRNEVAAAVNGTYDWAFSMGVQADDGEVEDGSEPIEFDPDL